MSLTEMLRIVALVVLAHVASMLPATITLAVVGYRRAVRHRGWQAVGFWVGGNLMIVIPPPMLLWDIGWWAAPLAWVLPLTVAWVLSRRPPAQAPRGW